MLIPDPITPIPQPAPFDDPEWILRDQAYGVRALAVIEHGHLSVFSRKKHRLTGHRELCDLLVKEVNAEHIVMEAKSS